MGGEASILAKEGQRERSEDVLTQMKTNALAFLPVFRTARPIAITILVMSRVVMIATVSGISAMISRLITSVTIASRRLSLFAFTLTVMIVSFPVSVSYMAARLPIGALSTTISAITSSISIP